MTEPIEKKASHRAPVVRITADMIKPHPDPETTSLELIHLSDPDYQLVVRKGQFKSGDLAVYIQPDSVVPQTEPFKFIWDGHVGLDGTVPERRRRVTVRKFRKEWSEGLLLPVTDFTGTNRFLVIEGDDVSEVLGITHYDPETDNASTKAPSSNGPKRKFKFPRTLRGWFGLLRSFFRNGGRIRELTVDVPIPIPTYDVDAFKNYKNAFVEGELVVVTEKIHGSNARFVYVDGVQYAGSRNQWKGGNSVWHQALEQQPLIGQWCKDHPGYVLWGEVVPTQGGFNYGCKKGEVKFFAFDIYTPEGTWLDFDEFTKALSTEELTRGIEKVPLLYYGPFDLEKIEKLVNGRSLTLGTNHIREGLVIKTIKERRQRGLGRTQLKIVSNEFLAKDSK